MIQGKPKRDSRQLAAWRRAMVLLAKLRAAVAAAGIRVFDPVHRSTAHDKANAESRAALDLFPDAKGVEQYRLIAGSILPAKAEAI